MLSVEATLIVMSRLIHASMDEFVTSAGKRKHTGLDRVTTMHEHESSVEIRHQRQLHQNVINVTRISDQESIFMMFCSSYKIFLSIQNSSKLVNSFLNGWLLICMSRSRIFQLPFPVNRCKLYIEMIKLNAIKDKDPPSKWSTFTLFNVL